MSPASFYELSAEFPDERLYLEDTQDEYPSDGLPRFVVWTTFELTDAFGARTWDRDDIIGAADTIEAAVAEARETLRSWAEEES